MTKSVGLLIADFLLELYGGHKSLKFVRQMSLTLRQLIFEGVAAVLKL